VLIIDADCVPERGAISLLARTVHASGCPVQARNGLTAPPDAAPMVQISNFAFLMKNFVRQRGGVHLGGPALLTGTGMAFPWPIFATAPLASGNIVEDLALGIHCARTGVTPRYCDQARVWSAAADQAETLTQRRRWEHGFLSTARSYGVPLIVEGLGRGRWSLIYLGLHLLVPPLTLLLLIGVITLGVLAVLTLTGAGFGALSVFAVLVAQCGALTLLSWVRFGRSVLAASTLIQLPLYVLWKIPVYLGFLKKRETDWVRTKRAGE
jgi:cellulose synthase/poly-beta-1,6-N-acetylglucosamine synthase-like glycosyltransferase